MMKTKIFILIFLFLFLSSNIAFAGQSTQNANLEVQFFFSKVCPHCAAEGTFLESLKEKYPAVTFNYYSIEGSQNVKFLLSFYQRYNVPLAEQGAVPITFVGEDYFVGFDSPVGIGRKIETSIKRQLGVQVEKQISKLPLIDQIDTEKWSLPVISVFLGFVDGFNVCSLGAIILILSLVLALKSRKKTLVLGGVFILTTAIVYGLLILAWHRLFSLLANWARLMQIVVAIVVIAGAGYFLKEFLRLKKYGPVCELEKSKIYSKLTRWFNEFFEKPQSIAMLAGVVLLFAAAIAIIEFPCSAVVPLAFAGILAAAQLPITLTFVYLSIFISFYLLDELLVFMAAVLTQKIWLASPKFLTWLNLFAAIILILLGVSYLIGFVI